MYLFRASLFALILSFTALAQTAADLETPQVDRVGKHIACQCGSCKSTVMCKMEGGCGYCARSKKQIYDLQKQGKPDQAIIAQMVGESGPDSFLGDPSAAGYVAPYIALAFGLLVIFWFVRKHLRTQQALAAGPVADPALLERYHERMEKDLEDLE